MKLNMLHLTVWPGYACIALLLSQYTVVQFMLGNISSLIGVRIHIASVPAFTALYLASTVDKETTLLLFTRLNNWTRSKMKHISRSWLPVFHITNPIRLFVFDSLIWMSAKIENTKTNWLEGPSNFVQWKCRVHMLEEEHDLWDFIEKLGVEPTDPALTLIASFSSATGDWWSLSLGKLNSGLGT